MELLGLTGDLESSVPVALSPQSSVQWDHPILTSWKGLFPPPSDQAWGGPFGVGSPPPRPEQRSTAQAFSVPPDIPGTFGPGLSW